jgi:hypothetical protein
MREETAAAPEVGISISAMRKRHARVNPPPR